MKIVDLIRTSMLVKGVDLVQFFNKSFLLYAVEFIQVLVQGANIYIKGLWDFCHL